jgi:hypothetical protein
VRRPSLLLLALLLAVLQVTRVDAAPLEPDASAPPAPPGAPAGGADQAVRYELPIPGAVLRGFTAPEHPYAPGHRGVDLAARAGAPVRAAAGGEVTFAGTVARARWVTIRHRDGIRTSYGALGEVRVRPGEAVTRGQVIGTATGAHGEDVLRPEPGLHWSARRGDEYLDPLSLLVGPLPRPTLVGAGGWAGSHPVVTPYAPYEGGSRFAILATPSPRAEEPGFARPPNHHHLLLLPGYATEGPEPIVDPGHLGYGDRDASTFSYRGCVPSPTGCAPRPYGGQDTDLSMDEAAALLDAQLRALQRAQPHRPVDLVGHSMGGDLATHYLTFVYDPTDPGLPPIGNAATLATPHGGSGTASIARAVADDPVLGRLGELARLGARFFGVTGADRVSLRSRPLARYGSAVWGDRPARDPDRLAELGVPVLEVAGSRDLVVGRTDAGSRGDALVLPGGHTSVIETEALVATLHDHLAGRPLVEVDARVGWGSDAVSDAGRTIGTLIDLSPLRSFGRALAAGDVAAGLWEATKRFVGGIADGGEPSPPPELPMAPGSPLEAENAWS